MRFTAVVVAATALAANVSASACRPNGRPSGKWGNWGGHGNWGRVTSTVTSTITPSAPAPTVPAVVPTPEPVVEEPVETTPSVTPTPAAEPVVEQPVVEETTSSAAPTATAAASSGSSGLSSDQQKALDAHNAARAEVGVPDLVWDATLASNAQEWATHLLSVGDLTHSQTNSEGENLYMQYSTDAPNVNAANAWLGEKSLYKGETISADNYMGFGHYTQAVWKSTTKVGMAFATDSKGATYVVARYSPPGNYLGEKPY
ncbi:pathogenesis-related protein [Colletotrichum truncatum]|uniref:Pathogenesis-related protein n=1 Tax=Colletotrichum truncatum TaxID=5467 RepID=A0ACC3Z654_COLTU|nr:pathogenesis-related protein [Colletotrichum truncatum]KAF6787132.1 pathogenesis-related protein [Colletotrichum truncatum]